MKSCCTVLFLHPTKYTPLGLGASGMQVEARVSRVNGQGIGQLQFPLSHAVKRDIRYGLGNRMKSQPLFQWPLGGQLVGDWTVTSAVRHSAAPF